jgi:hypothetical protein
VQLCPRALSVLKRQLLLRARLKAAGKIHHDHVFFLDTGEPFRILHHPQVRWRKTLQSLKLRYRRPYTARQTSVSWDLMIGRNPLWVAKQHGHSIATMLRAYAAWAEGTAEVYVEAIKRSMDRTVPLPTENLAVDLPVDKAVQTLSAPLPAPTSTPGPGASLLNQQEKMEEKSFALCGWGGRIIRPCGPHPFGAARGALTRVTARTNQPPQRDQQHWPLHRAPRTLSFPSWHRPRATLSRDEWLLPTNLAGVEGFEPPNGGIKTRDRNQHNQQVAETTGRLVPLHTPRFPIAATKPATSGWLTADVMGPARGTTNHLACKPGPSNGTPSRYTSPATDASPGAIRRSREKSHIRLSKTS